MAFKFFNFCVLLLFAVLVQTSIAAFQESECDDKTEGEVQSYVGSQVGLSGDEMDRRHVLADKLSERSFTKTWASSLTLEQYEAINFGGTVVKENKHRFSYPEGEASGGYRNTNIPGNDPFKTWELHAREVMQWTYDYMLQLSGQIAGYGDLFPEKPTLDGGCAQRFHATHAELKLMTRMMRQGALPEAQNLVISVSRHMCTYCVPIVAHLARNGRRRVAVVAPRKKSKGSKNSIEQPEYILFEPDGSFTRFQRKDASSGSLYSCRKSTFTGAIPEGLDTYHPPNVPNAARQVAQQTAQQIRLLTRPEESADQVERAPIIDLQPLRDALASLCPDETEGPGNECITFIGGDLPKSVDCPSTETMTGVHGTFGPLSDENPVIVLKSIGSFCEVTTKVPEMGSTSSIPFELKCPDDYQLSGFYGSFGLLVDELGIICRRISDGAQWKSSLVGSSGGGVFQEKECEAGAAGRQIKLWVAEAVDGFGLCCR